MVLRHRENKNMTSEQPLKKKLRRGDDTEATDEPDFIHNISESRVSPLHLSLPVNINEDYITLNTVNAQLHHNSGGDKSLAVFRTSDSDSDGEHENSPINSVPYITNNENISIQPAPDIIASNFPQPFIDSFLHCNYTSKFSSNMNCIQKDQNNRTTNHDRQLSMEQQQITTIQDSENLDDDFQKHLIKQCLCNISEATLRKPFEGQQINDSTGIRTAMLSEWSSTKVLQFLSNLQLLFDVYLKQNNKGYICPRIVNICDTIIRNEYNLIEQIISLCDLRNKYVNFMAARVLSSFLIIAKTDINNEWLETIVNFLTVENIDYVKMNFALEIVKRVVEWKDVEIHVLEESDSQELAGTSSSTHEIREVIISNCKPESCDPESYDTSDIKGLIIKSLESNWPELIQRVQNLILTNTSVQAQTCTLTFLSLWESMISVKANLSIIDTKPFYAYLENFVEILTNNLPPIIWKQLLSLFNEVLCYGSTLALQDMLPEDACQLAHLVVRHVKDFHLLDRLPYRREEGFTVNSFVGTFLSTQPIQTNIDKTLLQKMVLLVLKSVAITIKETRSDSSDSSVGSDDFDYNQDMQLIERSIRDVLKKVDVFLKNSLDFHPETPFSKILIHLFSDQDDYMIEAMVCTLDITVGISYINAVFPDLTNMLNPIHSFIEFLKIVSHDSGVLLDYLVSNETCFLLYLLRFLKYTRRNWSKFVDSCGEGSSSRGNELDDTMTVLIRLKFQIDRLVLRNLFPYNISPVLKLLGKCEKLYEGNAYS